MMTGCRASYSAMSRHPTTDAGMWGTGRKGLAAQYRMMPRCRVSYPALSRDPTTDAVMRRAGAGLAIQDRMMTGCKVSCPSPPEIEAGMTPG